MIVCVCFNTNSCQVACAIEQAKGQGSPKDVLRAAGAPVQPGNCMKCVPMTREMVVEFRRRHGLSEAPDKP